MITGHATDAGRNESGLKEKNDCTIRAYALMKDISYLDAYGKFYLAGRKPRSRTSVHHNIYDKEFSRLNRPHMTVKSFLEAFHFLPRCIIQVRGHVFTVVKNQILDINPTACLNCHVLMVWIPKV